MTENRIRHIDVAKGLLIICVVLGHIAGICKEYGGINNDYLNHTGWLLAMFYIPFYMQAFFLITGYTSNFKKPFALFLKQNAQRILLPYVCFGILYAAFNKFFFGHDFFYTTMDGETLFFLVEYYWFLSSLFIARMLFWFLDRINNKGLMILLCLVLLFVGIGISSYYKSNIGTSHFHNFFHYRNALMMLFFMGIGAVLKHYPPQVVNLLVVAGSIIYFAIFVCFQILDIHIPSDGHGTSLQFEEVPMHLICATAGSFFIMLFSKGVFGRVSAVLQTFGRHSLTVYTVHYLILETIAASVGYIYQPVGKLAGAATYVFVACIALICNYYAVLLFKKKPFCYMLGKI